MANIINTLFPISGELQGVIFYQKDGKTHVRRKPIFPKNYFYQDSYRRSLENAIQFGGASRTASHIHLQLRAQLGDQLIPYAHNKLAATILKTCKADRDKHPHAYPHDRQGRMLPCFSGASVAKALLRLKLTKAHHSLTPITHIITKADGTKIYRVIGLPTIAQKMAKAKQRGAIREMRIRIILLHTRDILINDDQQSYARPHSTDLLPQPAPSDWFDATLLTETAPSPTGEGRGGAYHLDIPAPDLPDLPTPNQGDHLVTYLVIEWRDRKGKRTPAQLKEHTSLIPMEAIALHPEDQKPKPPRPSRNLKRLRTARRLLRKPIKPDLTPAQRLKAALIPILKE